MSIISVCLNEFCIELHVVNKVWIVNCWMSSVCYSENCHCQQHGQVCQKKWSLTPTSTRM